MREEVAPGLPADWLNGWLAAIGVTAILPEARLSWTENPIPVATFHVPDDTHLVERLTKRLPPGWIDHLAIRHLPRKVLRDEYAKAAEQTRVPDGTTHAGDFSLSASTTDLVRDSKLGEGGQLPHSPFDPSAPGTTGAVRDRLRSCMSALEQAATYEVAIAATLDGRGLRVQANGLGFDPRRLVSGVQAKPQVFVDPVIEILCFLGLSFFPVRGDGTRAQARGWTGPASKKGSFTWPVWTPALDAWAIDALLDRFYSDEPRGRLSRLGIRRAFTCVPYQALNKSDPTRAYASEPLRWP
ncbi:MAG: type I-G CRISPR-associated protein, Cas3-extension family [Actinomycetota bacterium]